MLLLPDYSRWSWLNALCSDVFLQPMVEPVTSPCPQIGTREDTSRYVVLNHADRSGVTRYSRRCNKTKKKKYRFYRPSDTRMPSSCSAISQAEFTWLARITWPFGYLSCFICGLVSLKVNAKKIWPPLWTSRSWCLGCYFVATEIKRTDLALISRQKRTLYSHTLYRYIAIHICLFYQDHIIYIVLYYNQWTCFWIPHRHL